MEKHIRNNNPIVVFIQKHLFEISLLCVFFFALFLRLYNISYNPVGLTHDEMFMALSAKSFVLSGTDLTTTWKPWKLIPATYDVPMGELIGMVNVIPAFFLPLSVFTMKLFPVMVSAFLSTTLALFVRVLTKNKLLAFISAVVIAINPWSIQFGRTMFEAPIVVVLVLFSFYLMVRMREFDDMKKRALLSFLVIILSCFGFYLYFGMKLIYPLIFMISSVYFYVTSNVKEKRRLLRPYLFIVLVIGIIFVRSMVIVTTSNQRTGELIPLNLGVYQKQVNDERRMALPSQMTSLFVNKATLGFRDIASRYFQAYSPTLLFLYGETRGAYSTWIHGLLYMLDALFIVLGALYLFKKHTAFSVFLLALLLVVPLPSALSNAEYSYVFRSALLFPLLCIFIAAGIYQIVLYVRENKNFVTISLSAMLALAYVSCFAYFLYVYHVRYPVYGSEGFFFSERLLSAYVQHVQDSPVVVFTSEPHHALESYLFYTNNIHKENIGALQKQFNHGIQTTYTFNNIVFTADCKILGEHVVQRPESIFVIRGEMTQDCSTVDKSPAYEDITSIMSTRFINIMEPGEARVLFKVFNDRVCDGVDRTYVRVTDPSQFAAEQLTRESYCDTWVTQPL